uniref:Uncharacterized protein n=1 Tax=viral metagenome TaxID=1070528 RepID=A0A6C0CNI0_9ZZZZ
MSNIISHEQHSEMINKQKEAQSILQSEIQRLSSKKANIDEEETNAQRMVLLNRSHRDRRQKYLIVMVLFVLVFGSCLFLTYFQERLGYSSIFIDLLIVIILGFGFITAYFMYQNIQSRDNIDFSKLNDTALIHPSKFENSFKKAQKSGDLTGMTQIICKGSECCGQGLTYSEINNQCE